MAEISSVNTIARERVEDFASRQGEPQWLREDRLKNFEEYFKSPDPSQSDELWRRTDLSELNLAELKPVDFGNTISGDYGASPESPDWYRSIVEYFPNRAGDLIQATGETGFTSLSQSQRAQGVIFCDLETAVREHAELVKPYLTRKGRPDMEGKYGLLNQAMFNGGLFLYVPCGVEIPLPFISGLAYTGNFGAKHGAIFPRLIVVAEKGASLTLVHVSQSSNLSEASLNAGLVEIHVGEGAHVSYLEMLKFGTNVFALNRAHNQVHRDGRLTSLTVALGGTLVRGDITTELKESGARSEILGMVLGGGEDRYHFNTIQVHDAPDTTSDINFRVALKEAASSVYQGIIKVEKVAQRTVAYQSNKNVILGSRARADSIPNLEILADDVKCSHGATIGQIDQEQIFYLVSRGFTQAEAEQLIVFGFFKKVLDRFPLPESIELLSDAVSEKLDMSARSQKR